MTLTHYEDILAEHYDWMNGGWDRPGNQVSLSRATTGTAPVQTEAGSPGEAGPSRVGGRHRRT